MPRFDIYSYNSKAWNQEVDEGSPWSIPVSTHTIDRAKKGQWSITLTPQKPIPKSWFPNSLKNKKILCLAGGGGQQGPILAAAGAKVTVFDASEKQLGRDREVARRENLILKTIQGDMLNLGCFKSNTFDLIVHPISNCFVPKIERIWKETYRVLKPKGKLMSGFMNPVWFSSDRELQEEGKIKLIHKIPYSDVGSLPKRELKKLMQENITLEFGHSLEEQIGGQIKVGFSIIGFYEDYWGIKNLDKYIAQHCATLAIKGNN
jgi:ubiquinone/menaquinone biosynthesis C-methylase UbiE